MPVFRINGPIAADPDSGYVALFENDIRALGRTGQMINGITTTGYLNILAHQCGVHRTTDDFCHLLDEAHRKSGEEGMFDWFVANSIESNRGDQCIHWAKDPLILVQVFRGQTDYGHWASLVIDRTVKPGLAVFFDSLPGYCPKSMEMLQEKLSAFPLEDLSWIRADMPKQARGTMDCGVLMSLGMAAYVRGRSQWLRQRERLVAEREIKEVKFVATDDMYDIGLYGRAHIVDTLDSGEVNLDADVFKDFVVEWLE